MFYIIYGNDNYRCHEALGKIKSDLGNSEIADINTVRLDGRKLTISELTEVCNMVPFMAGKRLVIVEGLLKRFQTGDSQTEGDSREGENQQLKEWRKFIEYVTVMPDSTLLVLFEPDIDLKAGNPLLKSFIPVADHVVQLQELRGKELIAWIKDYTSKNGGKITQAALTMLADYLGGDLWSLSSEINKLITFCGEREITDDDVRKITSYVREENIFSLVDSVLEGRIKEAQQMVNRMLKYGTSPLQIMALIEKQLRVILIIKGIPPDTPIGQIKEKLGLNPRYPLEKTLKQARDFTVPRLRRCFHCLLDTDLAIKMGKYEDELALNLMIIELCKN